MSYRTLDSEPSAKKQI